MDSYNILLMGKRIDINLLNKNKTVNIFGYKYGKDEYQKVSELNDLYKIYEVDEFNLRSGFVNFNDNKYLKNAAGYAYLMYNTYKGTKDTEIKDYEDIKNKFDNILKVDDYSQINSESLENNYNKYNDPLWHVFLYAREFVNEPKHIQKEELETLKKSIVPNVKHSDMKEWEKDENFSIDNDFCFDNFSDIDSPCM